jgi:hypothetical protein
MDLRGHRSTAERPALQLPPRRAPQDDFKKPTISRAEGGSLSSSLALHHLPCLGKMAQTSASTRRRNSSKLARP